MKAFVFILIHLAFSVHLCIAQSFDDAGRRIFETNCAKCHGTAGNKGRFGAEDLTISKLQMEAVRKIIQNGKSIMPAWEKRLSSDEIDQVIRYIFTLRRRV